MPINQTDSGPVRIPYTLIRTSANKQTARTGCPLSSSFELVGVDGSLHGGLRPLNGLEKIYELDFYDHALHDETSVVNWFRPVHFRVGSEYYGFGVVYRAVRSRRLGGSTSSNASVSTTSLTGSHSYSTGYDLGSSTSSGNPSGEPGKADVFIDFWNSATDSLTSFGARGEILVEGVDPTAQMDVVVVGRLVYIFISGRSPSLFYIEAVDALVSFAGNTTSASGSTSSGQSSRASSYTIRKLGRVSTGPFPGPGRQPILASPHYAVPLGTLPVPTAGMLHKRPLVGQVVLTPMGPITSGLFGEADAFAGGSLSGWGSSSFYETTNFPGSGTGSSSFDEVTSDGFGSNTSMRTSSSSFSYKTLTTSSSSSISISQTPGSTFTDPTSSCSNTSGTASVGATLPKILADHIVQVPRPKPPLSSGMTALGLMNRLNTQHIQVLGVAAGGNDPFGPSVGIPPAHVKTWELYCQDLEDWAASASGRTGLDSPVATGTFTLSGYGYYSFSVTPSDYMVIKPGHTYLWGMRLFNANTSCGIILGNADEAINPGGDNFVDPAMSEEDFVNDVVGGKYKFHVAESVPAGTSASSNDPGPGLGKFAAEKYEPGDYVFGVQLVDSKTGRKSAFSEVAQVQEETFTEAAGTSSELSEDRKALYIAMEFAYDPTKFDQAYIYRSVKVQDAGGTLVARIQHLESVINLVEYHTNRNQGEGQWAGQTYKHVVYWYKLEDKQLIFQDGYLDEPLFDEDMPKGGAASFYGNTMLVSKISDAGPKSTVDEVRVDDAIRGVGELRWSSLTNYSPELFPPGARYVPAVPTSEIISFKKTGHNCIGLSLDKLYHIRREGQYIKPQEMHEGYGIVAQKALDVAGSTLYYVTHQGLKMVSSAGELSELSVLDQKIIVDWVGTLGSISMAYDPTLSALFIHNATHEQTAVIWFGTLMMTELHDMVFHSVEKGVWPSVYTNYGSPLEERAIFLQNPPKTSASDQIKGMKPRLFVVDHDRSKTASGGEPRRSLLHPVGATDRTRQITSGAVSSTVVTVTKSLPTDIEGCYVYVLDSSTASYIGKKVKVVERLSATTFRVASGSDFVGLPDASRIGISPVFFQWIGPNLPMAGADGTPFAEQDFNVVRKIDTIYASFVDVSGAPVGDEISSSSSGFGDTTTDAKFEALAYRGTGSTPYAQAFARDRDGNLVASIQEFEGLRAAAFGDRADATLGRYGVVGTSLSPGIRIYCPDLDYRLLSVIVTGKILGTERTQRI